MDLATFAVDDGYAEAVVRGLRSSFLTPDIYEALKATQSIADFKTVLEDTDYGHYLISEPAQIPISLLRSRLKRKLADEFQYLTAQSVYPLSQFIHMMQSQYMIDNIVNIIEGVKNKVDFDILISQADPLGIFPELKAIKSVDPDNYSELYSTVLIDTPVGPYFMKFLEDVMEALNENISINEIQAIFRDIQPEFIRTSLKKMWLEDFYNFCTTQLNPISKEIMEDLLKFEADCKTIQVIYNSIGNKELSASANRSNKRKQLCPSLGYLYPDSEKDLVHASSLDQLRDGVKHISTYKDMLKDIPDPMKREHFSADAKGIDDVMYEEEVKRYSISFEQQCHYAVFYAYMKLKEQEIRNIVWLAEMVARKLPKSNKGWNKILLPFQY